MTDSTTTSNSARPSKRSLLLMLALVCVGCRGVATPDAEPTLFQSRPIPLTRPSAATVRVCGFQDDNEQLDLRPIERPVGDPESYEAHPVSRSDGSV